MKRTSAMLALSALVALTGGVSSAAASSSPNTGCGNAFTLTTNSALAGQMASWYADRSSDPGFWLGALQTFVDKDADGLVCFHLIGHMDTATGNPLIVLGDNSANANTTPA